MKVESGGQEYYLDGILKRNLDFIKEKVLKKNMDFVTVIDGRVGAGKSTFATQIALYFDPTFTLDNIVFTPQQFIEAVKKASKGQAIIFDEAMIISSRSAMSEFNKAVVFLMAQIRSKQLFIFFVLPSIFDLDRNLALHRCNLLLHCYSEEFGTRGRFAGFIEDNVKTLYLNGKKFYSYSRPKSNFYGRFTKHFTVDTEKYEKKKQNAIKNMTLKPRKIDNKFKVERDKLIKYLHTQYKLTQVDIGSIIKLSRQEIGNIIRGDR